MRGRIDDRFVIPTVSLSERPPHPPRFAFGKNEKGIITYCAETAFFLFTSLIPDP